MSLKQLSGGQKTLVALTLIFAIQRCDPAPFYLFDEIDAALDPLHRTSVAKLLKRQVVKAIASWDFVSIGCCVYQVEDEEHPAQFILTTFHPQIVQECNKIYGVTHQKRVSSVHVIEVEQALEFLQSQEPQQT